MAKKKHKKHKKELEKGGIIALAAALLSQIVGQILGDAVEIAAERLEEVGDRARKAMKKKAKARHGVDGAQAVSP